MITIIVDPYRYTRPPDKALVVDSIVGYVPLRQDIRRALNQQQDLTLYVSDGVVVEWLSDLTFYPPRVIAWDRVDPGEEFTHVFQVPIMEPFSRELIVALDLQSLPSRPLTADPDPISHILSVKLSPLWETSSVRELHKVELIAWALQYADGVDHTLLPLMRSRLAEWASQDTFYSIFQVEQLNAQASSLITRWALRNYDSDWISKQIWRDYPIIDLSVYQSLTIRVLEKHKQAIGDYWKYFFSTSEHSIDLLIRALDQMSGLSIDEFNVLIAIIEQHIEYLEQSIYEHIKTHFSALPQINSRLQYLVRQIAPLTPDSPDENWSADQWLRWATTQYIPYFSWTIHTDQPRQKQQDYAVRFSDWLIKKYPEFLNSDSAPILFSQYRHMRELLEKHVNNVVVWLVIDGLTWWQGEIIRDIAADEGLTIAGHIPSIAILPTITKISKRALVTGLPSIDIQEKTIAEAAREQLQRSGINAYVSYDITKAIDILQKQPEVRCLIILSNVIDVLSHQSTKFTDGGAIRGELKDIIHSVTNMQRVVKSQGRSLHTLIGSDHGGTILPSDAKLLKLPQSSFEVEDALDGEDSSKISQKQSARAAIVNDLTEVSNEQALWYILERNLYQLDQNYIVPRGYNYVQRRPTGWTHGGLTPEEVIVPLLHFTTDTIEILPPSVKITGTLRLRQKTSFRLMVSNQNEFPIDDVCFIVTAQSIKHIISRIDALSNYSTDIDLLEIDSEGEEYTIEWRIEYQVSGLRYDYKNNTSLPIRRLQSEDTSFDDLFED
jgi:hypothetical protein